MTKITELIESLSQRELFELKDKIEEGNIKRTIEQRLERFKNSKKVCPVCNSNVGEDGLTLTFGPADFKQRANFDAADCLEYFIHRVKK